MKRGIVAMALALVVGACGSGQPEPVPFDEFVAVSRSALEAIQRDAAGATRPGAARPILAIVDDEIARLQREPPASCYARLHARYHEYLAAMRALMVAVRDGQSEELVTLRSAVDRLEPEVLDELYAASDACR